MIVKNEAHVILRCLNSVKPLVDYVLIEDTGSTDGTQKLITEWLRRNNIPGAVIDEPWRDFAYNRSHAMTKLREVETVDYALIIDADDRLVTEPGFDPLAAYKADLRAGICTISRFGTAAPDSIGLNSAPTGWPSPSRPSCMNILERSPPEKICSAANARRVSTSGKRPWRRPQQEPEEISGTMRRGAGKGAADRDLDPLP